MGICRRPCADLKLLLDGGEVNGVKSRQRCHDCLAALAAAHGQINKLAYQIGTCMDELLGKGSAVQ